VGVGGIPPCILNLSIDEGDKGRELPIPIGEEAVWVLVTIWTL
jgi:hypothetical protein